MSLNFYSGCLFAGDYKEECLQAEKIGAVLGISWQQIGDWNCCGGTIVSQYDNRLALMLNYRNLMLSGKGDSDLVTLCPICCNRLKTTIYRRKKGDLEKENLFMPEGVANTKIYHLLEVLSQKIDLLKEKIKHPLAEIKAVPYYGCLLVRPPEVMGIEPFENPVLLDNMLSALGAEVLAWSSKTDCCGSFLNYSEELISACAVAKIIKEAVRVGASSIVTICPHCHRHLVNGQKLVNLYEDSNYNLQIVSYIELLAKALGIQA